MASIQFWTCQLLLLDIELVMSKQGEHTAKDIAGLKAIGKWDQRRGPQSIARDGAMAGVFRHVNMPKVLRKDTYSLCDQMSTLQ